MGWKAAFRFPAEKEIFLATTQEREETRKDVFATA
jgi:hypothetical protein